MTRLLRSPALSTALFALWLLLVESASPGNILLAAALALFWPAATARLAQGVPRARKPAVMAKLFVRVVGDMLKSNAEVMWALLTRRSVDLRSRFVSIPLELSAPAGLSILAMIVTLTPGTAWAQLSADKRVLLLHVFSASGAEPEPIVAMIKGRYECLLREIFE